MEVILKQDVSNLGLKDDLVAVKDGYARNFLIPKNMAIIASTSAKKMHAETVKQRQHKEQKLRDEAEALKEKLQDVKLTIGAKTSTKGKIFGSVNNIQIAEALKKDGHEIDRKNIKIKDDQIKEVGSYAATIKLYRDITVDVNFEVVAE